MIPQVNPLNNPACLLHWRVLPTSLQWLDRTRQEAVRVYLPVLPSFLCRYVPSPVTVVQDVPTCVVEEPKDWERENADTGVGRVISGGASAVPAEGVQDRQRV